MNWLESGEVLNAIGAFLAEDIGRGDITTSATVPADTIGVGRFLAKENLVLCGLDVAEAVFLCILECDCMCFLIVFVEYLVVVFIVLLFVLVISGYCVYF